MSCCLTNPTLLFLFDARFIHKISVTCSVHSLLKLYYSFLARIAARQQ